MNSFFLFGYYMDDPEIMLARKKNPQPVNLVCQQLTDYSGTTPLDIS